MVEAPFISTLIAVGLIPVAFLFTHAYFSGRGKLGFHKLTGSIGILLDLTFSIFYMVYRTIGGAVEGGVLSISPGMVTYFAIHGVIAVIVIAMELIILGTGILQWRRKTPNIWHRRLALPLYVLLLIAFISGEVVYLVYYVL